MKKVMIDNLIIEVTRRCNMSCGHCLRGEPENIDINMADVRAVLEQVKSLGTITFTGGEPTLNVPAIEQTLALAKELNVAVENFYIATNGKQVPERFVITCLQWYAYCNDNEISQVALSNTEYHQCEDVYDGGLLKGLSFFGLRNAIPTRYTREGRAAEFRDGRLPEKEEVELDDDVISGDIYLNCEGNVIIGCDWSYESQRRREDIFLCRAQENIMGVL